MADFSNLYNKCLNVGVTANRGLAGTERDYRSGKSLNISLLSYLQGILRFDTKVSDRTFKLGVT